MKWIVVLVTPPKQNDFRAGFFPRKFHYKRDAQELVEEIRRKGGVARIEKVRQ
jgi:hypothetical protein